MSTYLMPSRWARTAALVAFLWVLPLSGCLDSGGPDAPTISQQPQDRSAFLTGTATFDIGVGGKGPLRFQWRRNGAAIAGATGPLYSTPPLTATDNGAKFSVVVSNDADSVTSTEATLTVIGAPTVTTHPVSQTVAVGATATFSVTASGLSPAYQWRRNGVAVSGATAASYTTPATVALDDGAVYSVDVGNGAGIVSSNDATLTVTAPPAVVTAPLAQRVAIGERATFGVVATGGNLQYQWLRNGAVVAGATERRYVTPVILPGDNGAQYAVTVTNAQGTATSSAATLTAVVAAAAAPTTPFAEVSASRSVTPGESFTVVRRSNGSVSSWGYNTDGQRGDGTGSAISDTPSTVALPAGVSATRVAAGGNHALLLTTTGDVYAWGRNATGQLGLGDQLTRATPIKVTLPRAAIAIAAGRDFSVAVLDDGSVRTWGLNSIGQLGDGSRFSSLTPVEVTGITGVTAVAAGNDHVIALRTDGSVWGWGANAAGQLGNGGFGAARVPVASGAATDVVRIRAGGDVSLAVTGRRIGLAWGENTDGQLGLGGATANDVPTPTGVLADVVDGSAADRLLLFVGADGLLRASGSNESGSLGDGTTTARQTFAPVVAVANAIAASVGGRSFGIAVRADGRLLSWGDNTGDQLGNTALAASGTSTPTEVPGFSAGP